MIKKAYIKNQPKNIHIENIMKVYDIAEEKDILLKDFIKIFLAEYDKTCKLFSRFYMRLAQLSGIIDLRGQPFYLEL